MAPGGEIDVQWDMRSETGEKGTDGKVLEDGSRGHIQGSLLLAALREAGAIVSAFGDGATERDGRGEHREAKPLDYKYSSDAAKSNTPKGMEKFTPPVPQKRMVIKL